MKIRKVVIEGFRAYQKKEDGTFDFCHSDGSPADFVTIFAPNGFGKSSFYDAVEWAFTNNVERYIRLPHRLYNETAARGTKVASEPQYILRNTEMPADWPTSVNVDTTLKPFQRSLPTIRSDSRDLRFTEDQTEEDSYQFREIFLSQDAIDSFLRETKPEDRYIDFMASFGSSSEQARHKLHLTKQENNNIIDTINQELSLLQKKLEEPVDTQVFASYNATAHKLNATGEEVPSVTEDFSSITEHEILSRVLTRKNLLTNQFLEKTALKHSINQKIGLHEDLVRAQQFKKTASDEVEKYTKWISKTDHYQQLYSSEHSERTHLNETLIAIEYFSSLKSGAPSYINLKEQLRISRDEFEEFSKQLDGLNQSLAFENDRKNKLEKNILHANEKTLELITLKSQSPRLYAEIASNQSLLEQLETGHTVSVRDTALTDSSIEQFNTQLEKLRGIIIDRLFYESEEARALNISPELLTQLQSLDQRTNLLTEQIQSLYLSQDILRQHASQIDNLVSLGLEIVREHSPSACPLCSTPFRSVGELSDSIQSNSHLSETAKKTEALIIELTSMQVLAEENIASTIQSIETVREEAISKIMSALNLLHARKAKLDTDASEIHLKISSTKEQLDSLRARTFHLPLSSLEEKIANDRLVLDKELAETNKNLETCLVEIHNLETKSNIIGSDIWSLAQQISAIESDSEYIKHISEPISNNGNIETIINGYSFKIAELETQKENSINSTNQINALLKDLHTEMLAEGSWQPRDTLSMLLNRAREELATLESYISEYLNDLNKIIGKTLDQDANLIEIMLDEILKIDASEKIINEKIFLYTELESQLKALTPYVEHLKTAKRLSEVSEDLHKHQELDKKLSLEISEVSKHLKKQIQSFFFADLINGIYKKIDPHPSFTDIDFECDFGVDTKPRLNVVIKNKNSNQVISPNLYFSAAQLNILSLSIFLARALHAEFNGQPLDVILIDDPIHSMDSINILSTIDLLRSISIRFGKQIIISTHDENFYELLKKKIPSNEFSSRFLKLSTFGVVESDYA
jgi:exonuclease SbcC